MTTFKSKVNFGLVIIILVCLMPVAGILLIQFQGWVLALLIVILAFPQVVLYGLRYDIDGGFLIVRNWPCRGSKYRISDITDIKNTASLLAAPAASLDRIEIKFKNMRYPLIISPKKRDKFISELLKINPTINVRLK